MSEPRVMARSWRGALAEALDEQAESIDVSLVELENIHEILEHRGRDQLCQELRTFAAGLRSEASELREEARELRTTVEPGGAVAPEAWSVRALPRGR